jgi:hypothetical protein
MEIYVEWCVKASKEVKMVRVSKECKLISKRGRTCEVENDLAAVRVQVYAYD